MSNLAKKPEPAGWIRPESYVGLSDAIAAARLAEDGPNEYSPPRKTSLKELGLNALREPVVPALAGLSALYIALGLHNEGVLLLVCGIFCCAVLVARTWGTRQVFDAARPGRTVRTVVIRSRRRKRIPARDVVRGDLILLNAGDRVTADATVFESNNLELDESSLTGESRAVPKDPDNDHEVFSGTVVVQGIGLARVTATGPAARSATVAGRQVPFR